MSVRRLADEAIQPAAFAFTKDNASWAKKRIGLYPKGRQQSAIIPLLMRAQDQEGWVSRPAVEKVAEMLDMPYIRALEVATFYTQFQLQPVGTKAHVQVCGTTPCMLRGAEDLRAVCQRKINAAAHETNEDGTLSWEEVECAGACVNAPMVTIGHDTYEDLTPERLEEIIDAFVAGEGDSIQPGPQNGRQFSAPLDGPTTLTDVPERKPKRTAGGKADKQAPTKPGRKREVDVEAAPAMEDPGDSATDEAKAEKADDKSKKSKPKAATTTKASKPSHSSALFEAPAGAADDLKLISGVGPVLEKKLNALGITQYAQVAAFKKADVVKVDDALSFKGRIDRDAWIKQAKALAKGGEAEYVRVFGKKPR